MRIPHSIPVQFSSWKSAAGDVRPLAGFLAVLSLLLSTALASSLGAEEPEGGWKSAENRLKKSILAKNFEVARSIVSELAETNEVRGYKLILKYALGGHSYDLDRLGGRTIAAVESSNIRKEVCYLLICLT